MHKMLKELEIEGGKDSNYKVSKQIFNYLKKNLIIQIPLMSNRTYHLKWYFFEKKNIVYYTPTWQVWDHDSPSIFLFI